MAALAGTATVAAVYAGTLTVTTALDIGMVLAALTWLFFLVKIPWDLYFGARKARLDGQESQRRGLSGVEAATRQLLKMERYLLLGALAGHGLTAGAVYLLAWWRPELVRPDFSILFVGSVALRPAWEGYGYLRQRLHELSGQVCYPREDVNTLKGRVDQLQDSHSQQAHALERLREELQSRLNLLELNLSQSQSHQISELARLEKRTVQVSYRFEEVVATMSQDRDLLVGVRAFARLMRDPAACAQDR
jgi:hypothetical protein